MPDSPDPIHAVAAIHAAQALADVVRLGVAPHVEVVRAAADGWEVVVSVRPARASATTPDINDCERDVLAALSEANGARWTTNRVFTEMAQRNLAWGDATIKRALARLVALGQIGNSKRPPRGYWLISDIEELPLFRLRPA